MSYDINDIGVIITVPHSKCVVDAKCRTCDRRAAEFARLLFNNLQKHNIDTIKYESDTYRFCMDLNREISRHTAWRQQIKEKVEQFKKTKQFVFVFDCHSFPHNYDFGENIDVALLDHNIIHNKTVQLFNMIKNKNINVAILHGSQLNDIIWTIQQANIYAILIEVHENHNQFTIEQLEDVANAVTQFVIQAYNSHNTHNSCVLS